MAVEYLLLEDGSKLLLEDNSGLLLESSTPDVDPFPAWVNHMNIYAPLLAQ
jgi:hypothetical protein